MTPPYPSLATLMTVSTGDLIMVPSSSLPLMVAYQEPAVLGESAHVAPVVWMPQVQDGQVAPAS
jgi:hypothetical protein